MTATRRLPAELAFDPEKTAEEIGRFLRERLEAAKLERYVLGLSGGVDSACAAGLAVRALGADRLITVKLPFRSSSPASQADAEAVEEALGIPRERRLLVDITPIVDGWREAIAEASPPPLRVGNVAARGRMIVLWDLAVKYRGLVLGTENRTEELLGYFTIYGDAGTAVEPISGLYKSQVWTMAQYLGVPEQVIRKDPTADLWTGQTDEGELGISYVDADRVLHAVVNERLAAAEAANRTGVRLADVEHVLARYRATQFKRELPYHPGAGSEH